MLLIKNTKIFSNSLKGSRYRRRLIQNESKIIMVDYFLSCFKISHLTKKAINFIILKSETYHYKTIDHKIINERSVTYHSPDFRNNSS